MKRFDGHDGGLAPLARAVEDAPGVADLEDLSLDRVGVESRGPLWRTGLRRLGRSSGGSWRGSVVGFDRAEYGFARIGERHEGSHEDEEEVAPLDGLWVRRRPLRSVFRL